MHDYDIDTIDPAKSKAAPAGERERAGEVGRALAAGAAGRLGPDALLHLQRSAGNGGVAQLLADEEPADESPVKAVVGRGGGEPLEDGLRTDMEGRFGADFGGVRVHTDGQASESARAVNAHAYTVGEDIVFAGGRYDPASPTGQRTIAHELTHVVQQRSGPVDGSPTGDGIRLSSPGDRFEQAAEQGAERIMAAGPAAGPGPEDEEAGVQALGVQRDGEDDEEEAQGEFVQREGEEDEEEAQGEFVQRDGEDDEEEAQGQFVQRHGSDEAEPAAED